MRPNCQSLLVLTIVCLPVLLTACAQDNGSGQFPSWQMLPTVTTTSSGQNSGRFLAGEKIIIPLSVSIIDDQADVLSSNRSAEEIRMIMSKVNDIWSTAGIEIEVEQINRVSVPNAIAQQLVGGRYWPFYQRAGRDFELPRGTLLYAFYVKEIGGPNGITPVGSRSFFVMDTPSVNDERVTSHEIGHVLGLHHTLDNRNRLMFPGSNGTKLTQEEIGVARYFARGLLDGFR